MLRKSVIVAMLSCLPLHLPASTPGDAFIYFDKPLLGMETLAITPGYAVKIDGLRVTLAGDDPCPRTSGTRVAFVGGDPSGSFGCIVINKDTPQVRVRLVADGAVRFETWTVERAGNQAISLRRPSGQFVTRTAGYSMAQGSPQWNAMTTRWSIWDHDIFFGFVYLQADADNAAKLGYTINK